MTQEIRQDRLARRVINNNDYTKLIRKAVSKSFEKLKPFYITTGEYVVSFTKKYMKYPRLQVLFMAEQAAVFGRVTIGKRGHSFRLVAFLARLFGLFLGHLVEALVDLVMGESHC